MKPDITVAVCTCNRAELLRGCLASMQRASARPDLKWELLVVSNCCTDDTSSVVKAFGPKLPVREIVEPVLGLSRARNRALAEAVGRLVIFTDDDVEVGETWLSAYGEGSRKFPDAAFFGGAIRSKFACEKPGWLTDDLIEGDLAGVCMHYDRGNLEIESRCLGDLPWGANFAIRPERLQGLQFRSDLGVAGSGRLVGEETELLLRLIHAGYYGVYLPEALVLHLVPASRLTLRFVLRYAFGTGRSQARANWVAAPRNTRWRILWPNWYVRRAFSRSLRNIAASLNSGHPSPRVALYREGLQWGRIYEWSRAEATGRSCSQE